MNIVQQWTGINGSMIKDPGTFFSEYDESHGVGYPLAFMLLSFLVAALPLAVLSAALNLSTPDEAMFGFAVFLVLGVLFWIAGVVEALIAHAIVSLLGGRGVVPTLEAYAFPSLVRNVVWWIPLLNIGFGLYGLYLQIKGLAAFHDVSAGKAAVASILAAILYLPTIIILAAVIIMFVFDFGQTVQQPALLLVG